jgi:hypothetical protein
MAKIIAGAALTAAGITAMAYGGPFASGLGLKLANLGISMGASITLGGIAEELRGGGGYSGSMRQPAGARQCIIGHMRVTGIDVYLSDTGHQLNQIIAWAAHSCQSIDTTYFDGRAFHGNPHDYYGDGVFYYTGDDNTYQDESGNDYSFNGSDVVAGLGTTGALGQADGCWYHGLNGQDSNYWKSDCTLKGICASYVKLKYDSGQFSGPPGIKATIHGHNHIYDPRTGTYGYTNNAALVIAWLLCDDTWGIGCDYATEIDEEQLIVAANICDEHVALANGGYESRYTINGVFDTNTLPGSILDSMLQACAGRISYSGGKWAIYPGAWYGTTLSFSANDVAGNVKWTPKRKYRDLCNTVRATYISPIYPYVQSGYDQDHKNQNIFSGEWQPADAPEYACDAEHGYTSDVYRTSDGKKLIKDIRFQYVTSVAQAQRLMKIELMRNRYQGASQGVLPMKLSAYQTRAQDVITFNFSPLGWTNKYLEVDQFHFSPSTTAKGGPSLSCALKVLETSPAIYSWSTAEERGAEDTPSPKLGLSGSVTAPTNLVLADDANTSQLQADGTSIQRVLITWDSPDDPFVTTGGQIQIQYKYTSTAKPPDALAPTQDSSGAWTTAWISESAVSGDATSYYVSPLGYYTSIDVRIRAQRANGATSDWLELSATHTIVATSSLVDYLSSGDKTSLMSDYTAELTTQTSLDATAASLSVSAAAYNAAITAIGTTLIGAGAPSNWATTWPDGTTFGPSIGVKTLLANSWSTVSRTRSALQSAIAAAQAVQSGNSAVTSVANTYASVDCLSNADKINLISDYRAEQANQSSLDATAAGLSVSSTAYDNAVAQIGVALTNAGAPSNWATAWPDGTTFGPVVGIKTTLADRWSSIATARSNLQSAISAAQAAQAAGEVISASQLHRVSWAYSSLPTLPSSSYPAGYLAVTTDGLIVQVSSSASAWVAVGLSASIIQTGIFNAAVAEIINLNADNITTGTLSANKVLFPDGSALTTASRIITSAGVLTSDVTASSTSSIAAPGLLWTVGSSGTSDVYNLFAQLMFTNANSVSTQEVVVDLVADGNTSSPVASSSCYVGNSTLPPTNASFMASITGLSAGSHSLQIYIHLPASGSAVTLSVALTSGRPSPTKAVLQRVY